VSLDFASINRIKGHYYHYDHFIQHSFKAIYSEALPAQSWSNSTVLSPEKNIAGEVKGGRQIDSRASNGECPKHLQQGGNVTKIL